MVASIFDILQFLPLFGGPQGSNGGSNGEGGMKGRNFRAFLISRYEILDFFAVFIFAISEKGEFLVV